MLYHTIDVKALRRVRIVIFVTGQTSVYVHITLF